MDRIQHFMKQSVRTAIKNYLFQRLKSQICFDLILFRKKKGILFEFLKKMRQNFYFPFSIHSLFSSCNWFIGWWPSSFATNRFIVNADTNGQWKFRN